MYKILIADDEPGVVSLVRDYFEINGYEVITASDGIEAVRQVAKKPDIILLDINMPHVDGIEVCKRIRDHISCPIVFLTARIEDSDKINGFMAGGDDYIIKPFSLDELGARVAAHIRRDHRDSAKHEVLMCLVHRLQARLQIHHQHHRRRILDGHADLRRRRRLERIRPFLRAVHQREPARIKTIRFDQINGLAKKEKL